MTAKDLKNALLQEAVQGKLVPQIASEGNARDLLEEIRKEKLSHGLDFANAKSGKRKSKKETALAGSNPCDIADEEIPFDIPESWCWCRLGEIVINRDRERIPLSVAEREKLTKTYDYYGASGVIDKVDKYLFDKPLLLIGEDGANLLNRSTPIAFIAKGRYWVNNHAHVLDCDDRYIFMEYVMTYINSISLAKYVTGTAQPKMNQEKMNSIPFPLPPLAEQKRIVAAIEKFMPLIEEYGKKESELKALNEQIGSLTKKAILQEAVQGKLVPQIAAEGNAKDLLEEIKKEKVKLIKEGKFKKEKPLSEISEDEIPFDIPENWCWCRLGKIVQLTSGQDLQPEMYNSTQKGIPYITGASNFINEDVIINRWTESPKSIAIKEDLLLTCKGTVGEMAFLKEEKVHIARQVMSIRSSENINLRYVKFYLMTQIKNLKSKAKSMIPGIAREDVISSLIPLPPLAEQKRIVAAIEKLLPLCEKLGE